MTKTIGTISTKKAPKQDFNGNPNRFIVFNKETFEAKATTGSKYSAKKLAQALSDSTVDEFQYGYKRKL